MKKILIISFCAFILALGFSVFSPDVAFLQTQLIDIEDNPDNIEGATTFGGSLRLALLKFVNFILFFLGIIATLFVIYGGFLYITSGGDDGKTETAKKILMYSAIGIVIVLISFALVNTVINSGAGDRAST